MFGRTGPRSRLRAHSSTLSHASEPAVNEAEMSELLGSVRQLLPLSSKHCTVGIMSTVHHEGVSTIARGLANAAASTGAGRVLLCQVDADAHAAPQRPPFLFMESFTDTSFDGVSVGRIEGTMLAQAISGPVESGRTIMRSLTRSFDLVLVELPPASQSTIGPALSKALDGVILVVEAERSRSHALVATRKSIEKFGGKILGVVLNKRRYHIPEAVYRYL
jgi:Mrp family chromosome partitioning ATPase